MLAETYLRSSALICGLIFFLSGCSTTKKPAEPVTVEPPQPMQLAEAMRLIDTREEWTDRPAIHVPRHPAEEFLKDLTIVIDAGHGGEDGGATSTKPAGYKAGRAGEKEAFMNLRVALLLERLLKDAGVDVVMTRRGDGTIGLRERADVANDVKRRRDGGVGADLFVSIHHNAGRQGSNYTSVWYHGSVDDNEPDMDVARYLALELGRAMRTQVAKTSPIFSSQLMYASGFGVLRYTNMPAVLLECSFYTDPEEEQRLRDAGYNLREAYAIYVGLCEWAYCGRPTQTMPIVQTEGDQVTLTSTLDEGLPAWWGSDRSRILRSTVNVTLDGKRVPIEFDELSRKLTATLPMSVMQGEHDIVIHHQNYLKNHNFPQRYALDDGQIRQLPPRRPTRQPSRRPTTKPATTRAMAGTQHATTQVAAPQMNPRTTLPAKTSSTPSATSESARELYLKGRRHYAQGDWVNARRYFLAASAAGYRPRLFEDAPETYINRIRRREAERDAVNLTPLERAALKLGLTPTAPSESNAPVAPHGRPVLPSTTAATQRSE